MGGWNVDMRMLCWVSGTIRRDKITDDNIRKRVGVDNRSYH